MTTRSWAVDLALVIDTPDKIALGERPIFGGLELVTGEIRLSSTWNCTGELSVSVRECPSRDSDLTHTRVIVSDAVVLEADGAPQSFPFAVQLPAGPQGNSRWFIVAHFSTLALVFTARRKISLLAPAPVRGMMACLFTLADFSLDSEAVRIPLLGTLSAPGPHPTAYAFRPPADLARELDGVTLVVQEILLPPHGDRIVGAWEINPQEKHWAEYLVGGRRNLRRPFDMAATPFAACAPGGHGSLDRPAHVAPPYPHLMDEVRAHLTPFLDGRP